ncbi:MAG: phosphoglucomutase/phosphomannomutase family protein, partial [Dehalococcoidia bacterium]|nr:phosphoglucomutase/phosphomannomutase family protein [Dehalococcoidia bacterium]
MSGSIKFGTDGWRAVIAEDYTFDNVRICAQALASHLLKGGAQGIKVVVGYDTRFGSEDFAAATAEVLGANGIHVYLSTSAVPTPVVSHAVARLKAAAGVVITASHNPARWNGFKIKGPNGSSAPMDFIVKVESEIARLTSDNSPAAVRRHALQSLIDGGTVEWHDPTTPYLSALESLVDIEALRAMQGTVVVDSMFGAGTGLFERLLGGGELRIEELNGER